ncbi:hypothetical protein CBL_07314 [Carabus blaptoides fortunei]
MAYGGRSFTRTEALFFAGMDAYFRLALNNMSMEDFYVPDSSSDSLKEKKQKNKDELKVSKGKKNKNEEVKNLTKSEDKICETSETNQLSKRAKRRIRKNSPDSLEEKKQKDKDELSATKGKENKNEEAKNLTKSEDKICETLETNQLSKSAKRRRRKNKIIESTSSIDVNESQNIHKEKNQTIKDQQNNLSQSRKDEKNISQKTGKEQITIKAKEIVKEVVNKSKPKEKQKDTDSGKKSNNNSNNIKNQQKNKAEHIKSKIPQNQQKHNKLPLHIPADYSKLCEFNNSICSQGTNNDEYERFKTEHNKNDLRQFINSLENESKVDLTFTKSGDEDTDDMENGEWQTVRNKKEIKQNKKQVRTKYASCSMSGRSTNDDELWETDSFNDLIHSGSNDYRYLTNTDAAYSEFLSDKNTSANEHNNYYSPTFACENVPLCERKNMWPVIRSKSNADYSQLPVEHEQKEETEKIQSFVGNKDNWKNIKCKKKGKTRNVEQLTLYPLSHVQAQSSSNKTLPSQTQNNQLADIIKEGLWSLENVNVKHSFHTCTEQQMYVNDEIEVWEENMATYDIPDRLLLGLRCGLCSEPLSYPPITLSAENVPYNTPCLSNESMKIMRVHGEIFKIRFNYSNQMKQVSCTVQFTGPSADASKFMYEMHVMDMNNTGLQLMSKKYCGAMNDDIDDLKHSTMWHLDMVLPFASTDNLLKLRCLVTKV